MPGIETAIPFITSLVSVGNTWSAAATGSDELISSQYLWDFYSPPMIWGANFTSSLPTSDQHGNSHIGAWVGATYNRQSDLTGKPYAVGVVVLDYPIDVARVSVAELHGILGTMLAQYYYTGNTPTTCSNVISHGTWPSVRLIASTNFSVYVKYLGLYEKPYSNPTLSASGWFPPSSLSSLPTLSGPLGATDIRTRQSAINGYQYCDNPTAHNPWVSMPYFIPFTNGSVIGTILSDLQNAKANPSNSVYQTTIRFIRLLLVSSHLVNNVAPAADEAMMVCGGGGSGYTSCYTLVAVHRPYLLYRLENSSVRWVYRSEPNASVSADIYEFPPAPEYQKVLLEEGGYISDISVGFTRYDVTYSESEGFVQLYSLGYPTIKAGNAPYGSSLLSPATDRPMATPSSPSAYLSYGAGTVSLAALSATDTTTWRPIATLNWRPANYSPSKVPYVGYVTAYTSVGVLVGDGLPSYALYPAPNFSLTKPTGASLALGLGVADLGSAVVVNTANPVVVWG